MLHKKTYFLHSENEKWFFCAKKMKTFFGNIVLHSKMHICVQYEIIWTNYVTVIAITLVIWAESHEFSYMRGHFCEHFLKISSVFQVCYFSSKLGHIWWHLAKDSHLFDFFWILCVDFKIRSKRGAWPFISRGGILWNSWCISDETSTFVPINKFFKKSWANYKVHVVQIWPGFNWIDGNLSFLKGVDGKLSRHNHLVICTLNVV